MAAPTPDATGWGTWIGIIGGWLVALGTIFFNWRASSRKTGVDESALILGKWKDLVDTHERRIKEMTAEFDRYKKTTDETIDRLQTRVGELERKSANDDKTIRSLQDENAGLRRQIAQNSQSTAYQLKRIAGDDPIDELTEKLDRAGHNLRTNDGEV